MQGISSYLLLKQLPLKDIFREKERERVNKSSEIKGGISKLLWNDLKMLRSSKQKSISLF